MTCKDCVHYDVCLKYISLIAEEKIHKPLFPTENAEITCDHFKDRSRFVKLKTTIWCRHKPDRDVMRKFHESGIGKGMSEDSIFWTCANCGVWGSPIYSYCPHCGAKVRRENNNETQTD